MHLYNTSYPGCRKAWANREWDYWSSHKAPVPPAALCLASLLGVSSTGMRLCFSSVPHQQRSKYLPECSYSSVQEARHDCTTLEGKRLALTLQWHPKKARSTQSAGLSCYLMLGCQQYCTVYLLFHQKTQEHCIRGSVLNPQQVSLQARFFPIDSENQSPSPSSVCNLWQMRDWWHLKWKYFTAFPCNVVCLFAWH